MESLYLISISESKSISEDYCQKHFPKRFEFSRKFYHEEDKLRSIGAGALLFHFCNIDEESIQNGEYGKPYAPDYSKFFNLSHSGVFSCLAVDDDEIGVDIEQINSKHIKIAKRVYTDEELKWMEEDPERRFFILWTLKESVMKYFGDGLKMTPSSFSVMSAVKNHPLFINEQELYCQSYEIEGHMLSICCEHPLSMTTPQILTAEEIIN